VDEATFLGRRDDGPPVLLLAGRAWRVTHLDWKRRRAQVDPAEDAGRSRWRGGGQLLGHVLCRSIRKLLADDAPRSGWSRRAVARMEVIREEYPWLRGDEADVLLFSGEESAWWTFAGGRANAALAHELGTRLDAKVTSDNFAVRFPHHLRDAAITAAFDGLRGVDPRTLVAPVSEQAIEGLKFSECLPPPIWRGASCRHGSRMAAGWPSRWKAPYESCMNVEAIPPTSDRPGHDMKIHTFLGQIDLGSMALPEFQRGCVWNRDQVRDLMLSLYRKYPVGSFLTWATRSENADMRGDAGSSLKRHRDPHQFLSCSIRSELEINASLRIDV
jgi:hypothetical protein